MIYFITDFGFVLFVLFCFVLIRIKIPRGVVWELVVETFTYDLLSYHFKQFCIYLIKENTVMKKKHKHWKWGIGFTWEHKMKKIMLYLCYTFSLNSYYRLLDKVLKPFYSNSGVKVLLVCLQLFLWVIYLGQSLLGNNLQSPKTLFLLFSWCLFVSRPPPLICYWVSSYVWKEFAGICHIKLTLLFLCFFICTTRDLCWRFIRIIYSECSYSLVEKGMSWWSNYSISDSCINSVLTLSEW